MAETEAWRPMSKAPRDGSRILVTVRSVEQGPAEVDMAYWARADSFGAEGWRAADSNPGCIIAYAEPELKCWMPLPNSGAAAGRGFPEPHEGDEVLEDGAGI
ncbi:MAG: hypothetical protein Rhirs2KO_12080 [Rhizobiaceae bacterium]